MEKSDAAVDLECLELHNKQSEEIILLKANISMLENKDKIFENSLDKVIDKLDDVGNDLGKLTVSVGKLEQTASVFSKFLYILSTSALAVIGYLLMKVFNL